MKTVWILGDQLNRRNAAMNGRSPDAVRVLMIESQAALRSKRWHRQRLHLVLASMRRFAADLTQAGYEVDYRAAKSLEDGFRAHVRTHAPDRVIAMEPSSWDGRQLLRRLGVELVPSNHFLCHYDDFAEWAAGHKRLVLEDFYRWQRRRLGVLMDGDEPAGGRWNYDADNREPPPPKEARTWADPIRSRLDDLDRDVLASFPTNVFGSEPTGIWATSRRAALARLRHFVD